MWVLALGGVFLATAQGCVLCHLPARDLSGRLAQLCSQVEVLWKNCGASWSFPAFALGKLRRPGTGRATVATAPGVGQPVASQPGPSVAPSVHSPPGTHRPLPVGELLQALGRSGKNHRSLPVSADEASMNKVIEKTHRVLRVMGEVKGSGTTQGLGGAAGRGRRGGGGREGWWAGGDGNVCSGRCWGEGGGEPALGGALQNRCCLPRDQRVSFLPPFILALAATHQAPRVHQGRY